MAKAGRGAVFFDRDGVLNEDRGYVHRIEDFRWIEGAPEAIRLVNAAGLLAIVATNQSGVARGLYGEADVEALHAWMARELEAHGARIDAFYSCPYHEGGTVARYVAIDHPDRKPNPGMILRAMADFGVDPKKSLLVGDRASDLEAGARAGVAVRLFAGGSLERFVGELLAARADDRRQLPGLPGN